MNQKKSINIAKPNGTYLNHNIIKKSDKEFQLKRKRNKKNKECSKIKNLNQLKKKSKD